MTSWTRRALTSNVEIHCDDEDVEPGLLPLIASYRPNNEKADWQYRFVRHEKEHRLYFFESLLYSSENVQQVLDRFELDFYRALVQKASAYLVLHAAMLSRDGRCFVLAGASDSGKSTMARMLIANGWTYLSEEIVALASATDFAFLRRPLHLANQAECQELPPPYSIIPTQHAKTRWLGIPPAGAQKVQSISALLRLCHAPDEKPLLERLGPVDALQALWACRLNSGVERASIASTLVSSLPCYSIRTRDRASGLEMMESLISGDRWQNETPHGPIVDA